MKEIKQFEKLFSEYWDNKYSLIETKINKYKLKTYFKIIHHIVFL